jgi:hypothetical protein
MIVQKFGFHAGEAQEVFPATNNQEAIKAADDISAIEFLVFGTWDGFEAQVKTGHPSAYRHEVDLGVLSIQVTRLGPDWRLSVR